VNEFQIFKFITFYTFHFKYYFLKLIHFFDDFVLLQLSTQEWFILLYLDFPLLHNLIFLPKKFTWLTRTEQRSSDSAAELSGSWDFDFSFRIAFTGLEAFPDRLAGCPGWGQMALWTSWRMMGVTPSSRWTLTRSKKANRLESFRQNFCQFKVLGSWKIIKNTFFDNV